MPANARARLAAIVRKEFDKHTSKPTEVPVRKSFRGINLKLAKFDRGWDRKRGEAMRLTGVLLSEGDQAMEARVCESAASAKTYAGAVTWLTKEAEHLKRCSKLHEMAVARLSAVLARCSDTAAKT